MSRFFLRLFWLLSSITAWVIIYQIIATRDLTVAEYPFSQDRIAAYVAFILAPAITFIPIAKKLHIPLYDVEAMFAWSMLLFVIAFIDPGAQPSLYVLLLFLVSLVMSIATLLTLLSYAIGLRLFARRSQRYDFVRARREGYLGSMFLVGLLLLAFLDVLTAVNAALLGLIVFLLEVFLLSRGAPRERHPVRSWKAGLEPGEVALRDGQANGEA